MKHYIYTIGNVKVSRTYGGATYTARVYEITKDGPKFIGERTACNRSHRGEESEAWQVVLLVMSPAKRKRWEALDKEMRGDYTGEGYYNWRTAEAFGVKLHRL